MSVASSTEALEAPSSSQASLVQPEGDGNSDANPSKEKGQLRTRTALFLIFAIFLTSLSALIFVYYSFPDLEKEEAKHVKFPRDIDDAKQLGIVLSRYKEKYFTEVYGGVFVTYLFLQTFAIPGSIFLSIVSGFLFPFPLALFLICFCSATGASFCYLLSYLVGRRLVHKYLPERSASWSEKVQEHKHNMLSYIIFLRITPFLPNWFINIVSPVIDVDLRPFWLGTFIGVAPPSFFAIQAGTTLQQLTKAGDAVTASSVALLALFAILSILPVLFRDRKKIGDSLRSCYDWCNRRRTLSSKSPEPLSSAASSPSLSSSHEQIEAEVRLSQRCDVDNMDGKASSSKTLYDHRKKPN